MKKMLAAAILAGAASSAAAVPVQWSSGSGGNDHWYEFISTSVNWQGALTGAASFSHAGYQGYLATVTSAAETSFITTFVTTTLAWIAGTDQAVEGVWRWAAGPEAGQIFYGPGAPSGSYSNWNGGEPNNCCGGEDFLQMNWGVGGTWNDHGGPANASQTNGYLVEYSSVPQPAPAALLGLALGVLAVVRRARRSAR